MFPVAERVGRLIVSLPMFTAMTEADVERSVAAVKALLSAERLLQEPDSRLLQRNHSPMAAL